MKKRYALIVWVFFTVLKTSSAQSFNHIQISENPTSSQELLSLFSGENIFDRVNDQFSETYEEIARRQAEEIKEDGLFLGVNTIGYRYHHDFGSFVTYFNRTLAPDLFDDERWIVNNEMTIEVEASRLLSTFKDQGKIDIDEEGIGAFAGIVFKRKYRYVHFADSYEEGLTVDIKKLFFPFEVFKDNNFLLMNPYEFANKEDYLSFKAMGGGSIPVGEGLGVKFGGLLSYTKVAKVDIQAMGKDDHDGESNEAFKISFEKEKQVSKGASVALVVEFLNFLKFTLFSYDFSYSLSDSHRTYLSFSKDDVFQFYDQGPLGQNVKRIIDFKSFDSSIIAPYAVSIKKVKKELKKSKYSFLFFGGVKESSTSSIEIYKDGVIEKFFRHIYEKIRYKENFFSRLFNSLFRAIFDTDLFVSKDYNETRKLEVEYKYKSDLMKSKGDLDLDKNEENISVHFNMNFKSTSNKKRLRKKVRKYAQKILKHFTESDETIYKGIKTEKLIPPLTIDGHYRVDKSGLVEFFNRDHREVLRIIKKQCKSKSKSFFKRFRSLFTGCKNRLYRDYDRFHREWVHENYSYEDYKKCERESKKVSKRKSKRKKWHKKCLMEIGLKEKSLRNIPLWRFKDFSKRLFFEAKSTEDIKRYFSSDSLFLYGSVKAKKRDGSDFSSYYRDGKFNGVGVVGRHLIDLNLRTPASVNLE